MSGLDLDRNGVVDAPHLSRDYQDDLESSWRSPVSAAAGASYDFDHTTLHATVEWFNGMAEQRVMDPAPYRAQSTGEGEGVIGEFTTHDIDYHRMKIMLGFNLPFGNSVE